LILATICLGSYQNHESLPYKIYIVNRPFGGLILLSANVNLQTKTLDLQFNTAGYKELIKVKVAEIIGDYKDLNLLGTFDLECKELEFNQRFQQISLSIPKVKRGMILVTWLESVTINNKETISPIEKQYLFDTVKIIALEQERLTDICSFILIKLLTMVINL
jgi:hypothetical protein